MEALEVAAAMQRERAFAEELAVKFPILRAWPGKDQK